MSRRALLAAMAVAAAVAPAAQAAKLDSFKVEAVATVAPSMLFASPDGRVTVTMQCAAVDANASVFYVYKCSVGPLAASTHCGFECFTPFAYRVGSLPQGQYEFCVGASSFGATSKDFHQCAPIDPATGTAVIRR